MFYVRVVSEFLIVLNILYYFKLQKGDREEGERDEDMLKIDVNVADSQLEHSEQTVLQETETEVFESLLFDEEKEGGREVDVDGGGGRVNKEKEEDAEVRVVVEETGIRSLALVLSID